MNRLLSSKALIFILCLILLGAFLDQGEASAGTAQDPLVTLSYVENQIKPLEEKIAALESALEEKQGATPQGRSEDSLFRAHFFKAGTQVYFGESTQVILRSGEARAIVSPLGGLSDVTTGIDLGAGEAIPFNHLLIIPRDDGRGFSIEKDAYMMIMGPFAAEEPTTGE